VRQKALTKMPKVDKCPTGITGFDEITGGGLPRGRPSLITGRAGCGKTVFAMEFLIRGVTEYKEPGVFMAFEETDRDLAENFGSLGFDLNKLSVKKKIAIDHVYIERNEIEETGEYDLEGLFVRLGYAIDSVGAKRVVLDTIEALFSGLHSVGILRAELRRLFRWLKAKGVTAIVTAERADAALTRYGLEEYVADCVVLLDLRVSDQISTRRLRVVKYRGSSHGMNEYPFLIDKHGISVLPITSLGLDYAVSSERVSTGITQLDAMLDNEGYFRGSTILVSGTAGTGKTSIAAHFAAETCRRGERCLFLAFEESASQIIRNMGTIGIDLEPWMKKGRLVLNTSRPSSQGLEMHLLGIHNLVNVHRPSVVIVDPISNLVAAGIQLDVKSMLTRLVDYMKMQGITAVFTSLTGAEGGSFEYTDIGISSLMDTWVALWNVAEDGKRRKVLSVLKSRGMEHSDEMKKVVITNKGLLLEDM